MKGMNSCSRLCFAQNGEKASSMFLLKSVNCMSLRWRKNKSEIQKMYLLESINNILVVFVFFNVLKFYSFLKGFKGFWLVDLDRNTPRLKQCLVVMFLFFFFLLTYLFDRFRSIRIILFSYLVSIVKKCCFVLYYNSQFQMSLASFVQNKISS